MDASNSHTNRSIEIETFSLEIRKYPTDLLHSFIPTSPNTTLRRHNSHQLQEPEKEEDVEELNLGLSLDGRFGVDISHKGLVRSSSLAGAISLITEEEGATAAAIVRTASLPPEMEEEWRKRKELQSLRRMEAKRKRSEKKSSLNLYPGQPGKSNPGSEYPIHCGDLQGLVIEQQKQDGSQGSGESQGGSKSSSGASYSERNTNQGSCRVTKTAEVSSKKQLNSSDHQKKTREGKTVIGNMPCVFTIGDGPRGRKVEGILYRYEKGEEIRIMCVCHGSFFTPAEFVNHAGAQNVAHPLKRIVVNPNASPYL